MGPVRGAGRCSGKGNGVGTLCATLKNLGFVP